MAKTLTEIYQEMQGKTAELLDEKHRREITASTDKTLKGMNPRASIVRDYEEELFGIPEAELKKLPMVAVNAMKKALDHIMGETRKDPQLRSAAKRMINRLFSKAEKEADTPKKESVENTEEVVTEAQVIESYKEFLAVLSETRAIKFNYKMLLDLEPNKIMNPFFFQLLNTFNMVELTRQQKQGVLLFLKKLAELAESNNMIAQALNRIVRTENVATEQPAGETPAVEPAPVEGGTV